MRENWGTGGLSPQHFLRSPTLEQRKYLSATQDTNWLSIDLYAEKKELILKLVIIDIRRLSTKNGKLLINKCYNVEIIEREADPEPPNVCYCSLNIYIRLCEIFVNKLKKKKVFD